MNLHVDRSKVHDLLRRTTDPVIVDRCLLVLARMEYPDISHARLSAMINVPLSRVSAWLRLIEEEGIDHLIGRPTRAHQWEPYSRRPIEQVDNRKLPVDMAHLVDGKLLSFLDGLVRIDQDNWTEEADHLLGLVSSEIDLARVSVRASANLREGDHPDPPVVITNASDREGLDIVEQGTFLHYWKAELLKAIHSPAIDFRSDAYSFPIAHDFRAFSNGSYIGSIYLFRRIERGPFSLELRALLKQIEPQITAFLLTRILWKQSRSPLLLKFGEAVRAFSTRIPLTRAESKVAALSLAGESESEIANTLSLSIRTIQNHKHSIYTKAGVSSLSELFSRVLSDGFFDR